MKTVIKTKDAPEAIGTYSQAVRVGDTVYLSGQIGVDASLQCLLSETLPRLRRAVTGCTLDVDPLSLM